MVVVQPFHNIPSIPTYKQLMDIAFGRASRTSVKLPAVKDKLIIAKIKEIKRIEVSSSIIIDRLKNIVGSMPNIDSLHPFYRDLFCIMIDRDRYNLALKNLSWALNFIGRLRRKYIVEVRRASNPSEASQSRRAFYGRVSSIIKSVGGDLEFLSNVHKLKRLPALDFNFPIIIVCGAPNVGKSSFVKCVSTAEPEIAEYPFTTKNIIVGHLIGPHGVIAQIIDTPGLLDRPLEERNKIELQAIAALRNLHGGIVFLFDPTETCGYTLKYQFNVFKGVMDLFKDRPLVIGLTKIDLATKEQIDKAISLIGSYKIYLCNTLQCIGVKDIVEELLNQLKI
ncbi:MAG: GTPase [Candidatus Methanomethylicia archaeon]